MTHPAPVTRGVVRMLRGLALLAALALMPPPVLAQTAPEPASRPAMPAGATDPRLCQWRWTEGGGFGLWTEQCRFPTGLWQVDWVPAKGAFVLTRNAEAQASVLRPWPLGRGMHPDALLPGLEAAGLVPAGTDCRFVPAEPGAVGPMPRTRAAFVLRPANGASAGDGSASAEVPEPPCGDLGVSTHAMRHALTDLRWPAAMVFVDAGQEGNLIAPQTLTALPPDAAQADALPKAAIAAILDRFRADCADLGTGPLEIGPEAVQRIISEGDGAWLIDGAGLTCPGAATLVCGGTGGCAMVLLSDGGAAREVLAKGWQMARMGDVPVLLLQVHGSVCGGTNLRRCLRAVVLADGGFQSPGWE